MVDEDQDSQPKGEKVPWPIVVCTSKAILRTDQLPHNWINTCTSAEDQQQELDTALPRVFVVETWRYLRLYKRRRWQL